MNSVLNLIATDNFIVVNKILVRELNLECAVLLGELASEYIYWEKNGGLEDGYFYSTLENIQEKTSLTPYQQRQAINMLKDKGIIDVKIKGIPAKRYIKINEEQVVKILNNKMLKNLTTRSKKTEQLEVKKLNGNKNINNKNINKNKNKKEKEKEKYFENEEVNNIFIEFLQQRKKMKAVNSERAITLLINKLSKYDDDIKIKMIEQSILNSWKGVFEFKIKKEKESFYEQLDKW